MGAMNQVNLVAGLAFSLIVSGAYGADDLPNGAVRITAKELKWGPGRVPGQELAPLVGDGTKPGPLVRIAKASYRVNQALPAQVQPCSSTTNVHA